VPKGFCDFEPDMHALTLLSKTKYWGVAKKITFIFSPSFSIISIISIIIGFHRPYCDVLKS
jgi:hypothetical protein